MVDQEFDTSTGIVYLGDYEVFRTSTAEPTPEGIRWTYLKVRIGIAFNSNGMKLIRADTGHDPISSTFQDGTTDHI